MKVLDETTRNVPLAMQIIDVLTEIAKERRAECDSGFSAAMGGADIHFMTGPERALRHQMVLLLPTFAEQRIAAKANIAARIAARSCGSNSGAEIAGQPPEHRSDIPPA